MRNVCVYVRVHIWYSKGHHKINAHYAKAMYSDEHVATIIQPNQIINGQWLHKFASHCFRFHYNTYSWFCNETILQVPFIETNLDRLLCSFLFKICQRLQKSRSSRTLLQMLRCLPVEMCKWRARWKISAHSR